MVGSQVQNCHRGVPTAAERGFLGSRSTPGRSTPHTRCQGPRKALDLAAEKCTALPHDLRAESRFRHPLPFASLLSPMAAAPCACVKVVAAAPRRPQRRSVACGAAPSGPGGSKQPPPSRGPGAAPLRMQTDDQRKFGYGGDGCAWRSCVCCFLPSSGLTTSPSCCPRADRRRRQRPWRRRRRAMGAWKQRRRGAWLAAHGLASLAADSPRHTRAQVNPVGLAILGVVGLWAYWEWKRPGGRLNPRTRYA